MSPRLRVPAWGIAFACVLVLAVSATASAWVYSDLTWSLDETTNTYPTQFHVSTDGDGSISYRWLDSGMTKTTVISANNCSDLSLLGKSTFNGGDTDYHLLSTSPIGLCFVVRGRTNPGAGSTTVHDGRLRR